MYFVVFIECFHKGISRIFYFILLSWTSNYKHIYLNKCWEDWIGKKRLLIVNGLHK